MKKFYILTMALSLCASAFAAVPELESKNVTLQNPKFDTKGLSGWTVIGGWSDQSENSAPDGNYVRIMETAGNSIGSVMISQRVSAVGAGTYVLTAVGGVSRAGWAGNIDNLTNMYGCIYITDTPPEMATDIDMNTPGCTKIGETGGNWTDFMTMFTTVDANATLEIGFGIPASSNAIPKLNIRVDKFVLTYYPTTDQEAVKAYLEQTDYTMVKSVTVKTETGETGITVTDKKPFTLTATISPKDYSSKKEGVTWSTTNEIVATVSENGEVTPVGAGTCDIIATSNADALVYGTFKLEVDVEKVAVAGVTVSVPADGEAKVEVRKTLQLTATVSPYDATDQRVTWSSEDDGIATVDADGVVTGVKKGKVKITATSQENEQFKDDIEIEVFAIDVESVTMSQTEEKMVEGGTFTLTATVAPDNASEPEITWSVDGDAVEIAEADGVVTVTAVKTGNATVKATAGEKTATCEIEVVKPLEIEGAESVAIENAGFASDLSGWDATEEWSNKDNGIDGNYALVLDKSDCSPMIKQQVEGVGSGVYVLTAKGSYSRDSWRGNANNYGYAYFYVTDKPGETVSESTPGCTKVGDTYNNWTDLTAVLKVVAKEVTRADVTGPTLEIGFGLPTTTTVPKLDFRVDNFALTYYPTLDEDAVNALLDKKPYTMVEKIELKDSYTINGADKDVLTATIEPADATNQGIIWSSSNPDIVEVEQDGTIIGLEKGEADITATSAADGLIFAVCNVKVDQITGVDEIASAPADVKVYDVAGRYVGSDVNNLTKGIYIIREGNSAKKVNLK